MDDGTSYYDPSKHSPIEHCQHRQSHCRQRSSSLLGEHFHPLGPTATAGISKITTIADETGSFEFSDYTASGGVPPGIYHVTFFWPTGFSDNSEDRLQAEFSVAEDSQFTVVVNPGVNQFSPFRLVINSEKIIPAEYIP